MLDGALHAQIEKWISPEEFSQIRDEPNVESCGYQREMGNKREAHRQREKYACLTPSVERAPIIALTAIGLTSRHGFQESDDLDSVKLLFFLANKDLVQVL